MFATSTTYLGISLASALFDVKINIYGEIQSAADVELDSFKSLTQITVVPRLQNAQRFLPVINYVFSDAIVVWRAWVLWERNLKVLAVPIVLLLGTTVAALVSAGLEVKLATDGYDTMTDDSYGLLGKLQIAVWSLTLSTNFVATSLIAIKAWYAEFLFLKGRKAIIEILSMSTSLGSIDGL
ncbi:hypothetical protein EW146_g791 [Bondarzewia mesenterica]|uniref:Uncharacterized protein n=1 Tax=Bondarzewia mesenterica TaxID=1095465 RepID=A0A4S4M769_9AGAM|nr:hypothetical protein EW146_g791 [Bondarzewia mesenterica]